VAYKEFLHLRRDRLTAGMIAGIPLVMTLLFGFAINQDVRHLRAGYVDLAISPASVALLADANASQVVGVLVSAASLAQLDVMLRRGEISVGIYIPANFEQRLAHGRKPLAQLLLSGYMFPFEGMPRGAVSCRGFSVNPLLAHRSRYHPARRGIA